MNSRCDLKWKDAVNLIELCNEDPELAHEVVLNYNVRVSVLEDRKISCVPKSLLTFGFPSCRQVGQMISVVGTVIKQGQVMLSNVDTACYCASCDRDVYGKSCSTCGNTNIERRYCADQAVSRQSIRLQNVGNGSITEVLDVNLDEGDMGRFFPGERVTVTGDVSVRMSSSKIYDSPRLSLFVRARLITHSDEDVLEEHVNTLPSQRFKSWFDARKSMIADFSPEIVGCTCAKLGLILSILSGSIRGMRSSIHVLLVGEPSTGKTALMSGCLKLSYPSVYTKGVGASDAGLTTCAVRQGCNWSLEAGALILADNGVCCIDELESLKSSNKGSLLEAMEQQTISVAKAGIVTTLNARCSVIGSITTPSDLKTVEELKDFGGLGTPLLSRFDMIFNLRNDPNLFADICDEVVSRTDEISEKRSLRSVHLKSYLKRAKKTQAEIPEDVKSLISSYYRVRRQTTSRLEYCSMRILDGIMRMATAHSKLRLDPVVNIDDVVTSILISESCMGAKRIVKFDPERVFTDESTFEAAKRSIMEKISILSSECSHA